MSNQTNIRIHLDKFEKDFSFMLNGELYKTNAFGVNIKSL